MQESIERKPARNLGIDLLRIICMLMVVMIHVLGGGGVLESTTQFSLNYITGWTFKIMIYCAVNCYALISGYVGIYAKYKYTSIAILWLQVLLYSVLGTIIFFLINPAEVGGLRLLLSFLPVTQDGFWYFTAYFALFFCIPFLNRAILSLKRNHAKSICVIIILLFTFLPSITLIDIFDTQRGNSPFWLILLYILGACIRRFGFLTNISNKVLFAGYSVCVILGIVSKLFISLSIMPIINNFVADTTMSIYTSPTLVFCAISLLVFFSRMDIKSQKLATTIKRLAPVAFGVYLIHMQKEVYDFIFADGRFSFLAEQNPLIMLLGVVLVSIIIFFICAIIDGIRLYIFNKLRLKERLLRLEEKYIGDVWGSNTNSDAN